MHMQTNMDTQHARMNMHTGEFAPVIEHGLRETELYGNRSTGTKIEKPKLTFFVYSLHFLIKEGIK